MKSVLAMLVLGASLASCSVEHMGNSSMSFQPFGSAREKNVDLKNEESAGKSGISALSRAN